MSSLPLATVVASALASAAAGTDGFCQCLPKAEYPFASAFCGNYAYSQQECDNIPYCEYDCGCSCQPTPAYDPAASGYCAYMSATLAMCLSANPAVCEAKCPASETVMTNCACKATQFYDPAASSYCAYFDTEEACGFASPGVCEYACEAQCGCVPQEALGDNAAAAAYCAQFTESEGQCEQSGAGTCRYSPCSADALSFATRARAAAELAWFDHQYLLVLGAAAVAAGAALAFVARRRRAAAEHKYAALPTEDAALLAA